MKHVLIVDDDLNDLAALTKILKADGWVVTSVSDGAQALDVLAGNGFSLILIDIRLPTLSGYDLLRLLREKVNHSSKMIYVSVVPEKKVVIDGADGFIQKPFSGETVMKTVNKIIKK